MRNCLLIICGIFACQFLIAQSEFVVLHVSGKVHYYPPQQSAAQSVHPGIRLPEAGKVRCQSGGSVKLLYEGRTISISDGKVRQLSELAQQAKGSSTMNFAGRFWSFLTGSMKETKDEKAIEENHKRYMEVAYAGVKGYAQRQYAVRSGLIFSGNLGAAPVLFTWSGVPGDQVCRFVISRVEDGQAILSAHVRGRLFQVDFTQLALEPGATYSWVVMPTDEAADGPRTAETLFAFDPHGAGKVLENLRLLSEYKNAAPAEKFLMEAYALENAEFNYEAFEKYSEAASAFPGNLLVRDVRAAFLSRMDMLEEAKSILTK